MERSGIVYYIWKSCTIQPLEKYYVCPNFCPFLSQNRSTFYITYYRGTLAKFLPFFRAKIGVLSISLTIMESCLNFCPFWSQNQSTYYRGILLKFLSFLEESLKKIHSFTPLFNLRRATSYPKTRVWGPLHLILNFFFAHHLKLSYFFSR